ncbi:MAG: hypothetical protein GY865_01870, partial [candidate division Zixibacteria bacterium]|nr:hypothetical protein [candidate division Zixibacteria bacterium]
MAKIKTPGLLLRISHLILIQIFFIFAALALVLFYPQESDIPASDLSEIEQRCNLFSSQLSNLLANKSLSEGLDSVTSESLKNIAQTDNQLISLELYTTVSHKTYKKLFFYENRSHPDYDSILMAKEEFALFANNQLFENEHKKLHWSSCNNIITNMTVHAASDSKYVLVTHTSRPELIIAENAKGYLLLLLFLISTLISLL